MASIWRPTVALEDVEVFLEFEIGDLGREAVAEVEFHGRRADRSGGNVLRRNALRGLPGDRCPPERGGRRVGRVTFALRAAVPGICTVPVRSC